MPHSHAHEMDGLCTSCSLLSVPGMPRLFSVQIEAPWCRLTLDENSQRSITTFFKTNTFITQAHHPACISREGGSSGRPEADAFRRVRRESIFKSKYPSQQR